MNILVPSSTQPPLERRAWVRIPEASEPAVASVRPKAPMNLPEARGASQRCFCSSVPNAARGREPIVEWAFQPAAKD